MLSFLRRRIAEPDRAEPVLDTRAAPPASGALAFPDADLLSIFGIATDGINVSPRSALGLTAVSAAVRVLSETSGSLPFNVYRRGADESREMDRRHPAHRLLNGAANPWTSAADLRAQLVSDALLHGFGLAIANRSGDRVTELLRADPRGVSIVIDPTTSEPSFRVQLADGGQRSYRTDEVVYLRGPHVADDGFTGLATIKVCANAIRLGLALERHGVSLFEKGARPGGVLNVPAGTRIDAETRTRMRTSWQQYEGSGNAGRTPLLEAGITYQPHALSSVDSQYLETRRFVIDEISRAFGVPAYLLAELGRATWSNASELGRAFLAYGLSPWLGRLEAAYSRVLLTGAERDDVFIEAETDALVSADLKSRAEAYAQLRASGTVTANEARRWENLPARPDGDTLASPHVQSGAGPAVPQTGGAGDE